MPVWIRLTGLPVESWTKDILFSIASNVGKALRVNDNCFNLERSIYARVCVVVDLSITLALGVNVGEEDDPESFFQP